MFPEDGEPVEFLVDFGAKQRQEEEKRLAEMEQERADAEKNEYVHFVPNEGTLSYNLFYVIFSLTRFLVLR